MLLRGKTAIITGAASPRGIGLATAKQFAKEGARIAILDIDGPAAITAAQSLEQNGQQTHIGVACNVADQGSCTKAVETVIGAFGQIDILINNAGITQPVKVPRTSTPRLGPHPGRQPARRSLPLASGDAAHAQRRRPARSPACRRSPRSVAAASLGGAHYSAAKAGVLGLAKAMAREFGADNIRVNCVTPGLIVTDINIGKITPDKEKEILTGIPLGRLGEAADVAKSSCSWPPTYPATRPAP